MTIAVACATHSEIQTRQVGPPPFSVRAVLRGRCAIRLKLEEGATEPFTLCTPRLSNMYLDDIDAHAQTRQPFKATSEKARDIKTTAPQSNNTEIAKE